jgi:hypothetical protein
MRVGVLSPTHEHSLGGTAWPLARNRDSPCGDFPARPRLNRPAFHLPDLAHVFDAGRVFQMGNLWHGRGSLRKGWGAPLAVPRGVPSAVPGEARPEMTTRHRSGASQGVDSQSAVQARLLLLRRWRAPIATRPEVRRSPVEGSGMTTIQPRSRRSGSGPGQRS